ncbi:alpha/beta hydrolase [uncultured Thiohalocapsa sp.]|uniref:esterase/lipase family protein n=1 Tax=uncultured Thiohalocapsa sp. TaxID=768990 RepID=UPI0025F2A291|nr:alpha/beta hydrolase [uncultured Thiohalocapsa sp.]
MAHSFDSNNHVAEKLLQQLTAPIRLALEARAPWELGANVAAQPLLATAPKGDGHPVLVLPLMFGSDLNTLPLRGFLAGRGYAVSAWGQGVNLGPRAGVFDACRRRLTELADGYGRPVSLVGWSLGGLYARALSLALPGAVRQVLTLGTPISGEPRAADLWRGYERFTGDAMGLPPGLDDLHGPLPVPTTSLYSRSDGIVPWQHSVIPSGPLAENIVVESSHLGLGVNPLTLYAIADRLAQPADAWQPFSRDGLRAWLYPQ